MNIPELIIGHTLHILTEKISGKTQNYIPDQEDTIYICVELQICGSPTVQKFNNLSDVLNFSQHKNIIFRFLEYKDEENNGKILVLRNQLYGNKIYASQNIYGIGENWNLYINSKSDVTVQHFDLKNQNSTVRFRNFSETENFYIELSCLIYCLINCNNSDGNDIQANYNQIKLNVTK